MAVVARSVTTKAADDVVDVAISLAPGQVLVSPARSEALFLFAELVARAEIKAINCAAIGVSGYILGVRRRPGSGGRVPTLTAAP